MRIDLTHRRKNVALSNTNFTSLFVVTVQAYNQQYKVHSKLIISIVKRDLLLHTPLLDIAISIKINAKIQYLNIYNQSMKKCTFEIKEIIKFSNAC